jgi:hypothetical protein
MRISLLEKREDFYKILKETLSDFKDFFKDVDAKEQRFFINKYLNFIATSELDSNMFNILVKEYSTSLTAWKRPFQKLYVRVAIHSWFRIFFAQKQINLPARYERFLILGGNHRIRLFSPGLKSSYILLKKGESLRFVSNEIRLKSEVNPSYTPKIIDFGEGWIQETYFEGTPINRVSPEEGERIIKQVVQKHFNELLESTLYIQSESRFCEEKLNELNEVIYNENIRVDPAIIETIRKTTELIFRQLSGNGIVPLSWTHGDFQMANILVSDTEFKIIDWEASSKRFAFYDFFVLLGDMRIHGNLIEAIHRFEKRVPTYSLKISLPDKWKTILALEELLFTAHENFSVNFFHSGGHIEKLCIEINQIVKI